MGLRVVGAGVGRTGTESLKVALEQLLGGRCYHMLELINAPDGFRYWAAAGRGEMPDWDEVFDGYVAAVDWPAAAYWPEISEAYPDALVLLSTRASAEAWYKSASSTIFAAAPGMMERDDAGSMFGGMMSRFTPNIDDPAAAMAAYEAHNERVRQSVPADRLVEWQPGDGWGPLCERLGLAVPNEPFPHVNTTDMFLARREQMQPPAD